MKNSAQAQVLLQLGKDTGFPLGSSFPHNSQRWDLRGLHLSSSGEDPFKLHATLRQSNIAGWEIPCKWRCSMGTSSIYMVDFPASHVWWHWRVFATTNQMHVRVPPQASISWSPNRSGHLSDHMNILPKIRRGNCHLWAVESSLCLEKWEVSYQLCEWSLLSYPIFYKISPCTG